MRRVKPRMAGRLVWLAAATALQFGSGAGRAAGIDPRSISPQEPRERKESQDPPPVPLPKGKKLVLKDGTFQLARSYELKGERVRYFSVERTAWEELPADLVDWEATRKAEADEAKRHEEAAERVRTIKAQAVAEELDVDTSIEVAPGVFLPEEEGLWVIEGRMVLPLVPVGADLKRDKGRLLTQILIPVPVIPTRHKVQIAGKHAVLRITSGQPEFYMRTAEAQEPELELIRARLKGNAREVQRISIHFTGQQVEDRKSISVQRWRVAKGVYRLTLAESLQPGEYVIAQILPEGMNLYVWDFGVGTLASPASKKTATQSGKEKP